MKILIIEDEVKVATFIREGLAEIGYQVDVAHDGIAGHQLAAGGAYDLVIIDWLLPGKEGVTVCQELRDAFPNLPMIMLTAKDGLQDKITGLDSGADDYLTKPFAFAELTARIRALLRRRPGDDQAMLQIDDLVVDLIARKVFRGDEEVHLSSRELDLLIYFLQNHDRIIPRSELAEHVWDIHFETGTNFVDVYVNYLRKKLNAGNRNPLIFTVRGKGYQMKQL